jgi:hypothetical protein
MTSTERETPTLFDVVAEDLDGLRAKMTVLAADLASKAGRHGITCSDVRIYAMNAGWLTGQESEHRMNELRLGAVMRAAGLISTGSYRRSTVPQAKRSPNAVYVVREHSQGAA